MANYCKSIEDFKATLQGGGVRPTMFQVELDFPGIVVADQKQIKDDSIMLVKAASIPGSNVGQIAVPFRGRKLKVSGDRSFDDWTVTVINDNSFRLRSAFEEWSELIQNHNFTCGSNSIKEYFSTGIVRQLDRDGNQLRAYRFDGVWPSSVATIALNYDSVDQIEEYDVTFAVQYWHAVTGDGQLVSDAQRKTSYSNINAISS